MYIWPSRWVEWATMYRYTVPRGYREGRRYAV
jgi:hypothetical protein